MAGDAIKEEWLRVRNDLLEIDDFLDVYWSELSEEEREEETDLKMGLRLSRYIRVILSLRFNPQFIEQGIGRGKDLVVAFKEIGTNFDKNGLIRIREILEKFEDALGCKSPVENYLEALGEATDPAMEDDDEWIFELFD